MHFMIGAGLFAMNIDPMAPVMTLLFHIVFGAALGKFFVKFGGKDTTWQDLLNASQSPKRKGKTR